MQFIFLFLLGACLASYVMVLSQPYRKDLWRRSQCDGCSQPLTWPQLIPIYSSLIKPSKCSNCSHQPTLIYGVIELSLGLIFILNAWRWPQLDSQITIQLYCVLALHISLWDWQFKQIPLLDIILFVVLTLIWVILHKSLALTPLIILGTLVSLSTLWKVLKKPWILAIGDWCLLILASCWLEPWQLPTFLGLTGGIGILTALYYQHRYQKKLFPFAPAILIALWLTLLWG